MIQRANQVSLTSYGIRLIIIFIIYYIIIYFIKLNSCAKVGYTESG